MTAPRPAHALPYDANRDKFAPPTAAPRHAAPVAPPAPLPAGSHVNGYRAGTGPVDAPLYPRTEWVGSAL